MEPKVTFKNNEGKLEVIDGQQRLTTIMLLLRAFYVRFGSMKTEESMKTKELISKCLWKTDEFGTANLEDYTEQDIKDRNNNIIEAFLNYMKSKKLIK